MAQQELFQGWNQQVGGKGDGGAGWMMKNQDALRFALEEGEASPDVNDFDARKFLQELKAEQGKS